MPSVCLPLLPARLKLKQRLPLSLTMATMAMDMATLATMDMVMAMDMVTMVTMARGLLMLNLLLKQLLPLNPTMATTVMDMDI